MLKNSIDNTHPLLFILIKMILLSVFLALVACLIWLYDHSTFMGITFEHISQYLIVGGITGLFSALYDLRQNRKKGDESTL